ncbi:MAG TPA: indole-3-glycerol-phosphate synthase [Pseudonocardiaceae bacterium]
MTRFVETVLAADIPVIAEIKPKSGAGDDLLGGRDPIEIVRGYVDAGAHCLSVVTGKWFNGKLDLLRKVVSTTGLPVLQKDFITRESQVNTAAEIGAGAVLLTAGLITAASLRKLTELALSLGLTPFVEVTTEAEIESVPHAPECVIAVNNKDIAEKESLDADLGRSIRLLPAVLATGAACPVSASGIETPTQAADMLDAGYSGLLVGTTLLRAENPSAWFAGVAAKRVVAT